MQTPFFEYKKYGQGWKSLAQDSYQSAGGLAMITIPFLMFIENETVHKAIAVPFTLITAPFVIGAHTVDYLQRAREEWKRRDIGPAEQKIRDIFGDIAVKGYTPWGGGIEMKLTEACVHNVYEDNLEKSFPEADMHRMDIHHDREECAKDLLGNVAANICGKTRGFGAFIHGVEKRYLVVRKKGELTSTFYTATQINSLSDAPDNTVATATHSYYSKAIGHGRRENITHYAITELTDPNAIKNLKKLGL